jgi:hypothetical protein
MNTNQEQFALFRVDSRLISAFSDYGDVGDYVPFRRSFFLRFLLSSVFQGFLKVTFKIENNADRL